MFIGREKELERLEKLYKSDKSQMVIIYGRRRVGKTALINQFCKGKKNIFFAAQESSEETNLKELSRQIFGAENDNHPVFSSLNSALKEIAKRAKDESLVFVIDEYPYLARKSIEGCSSLLQNFVDHEMKDTKLFLIIAGSSISFMEGGVMASKNPQYGRITAKFHLKPFDYKDSGRWFPNYTPAEKAIMYGVTGGIPRYLELFDPESSIKENLIEYFFEPNSVLFSEHEDLLKQELREIVQYNAIITAIVNGKTRFSEIADATKIDSGALTKYIQALIELGIIKKVAPIGSNSNNKRTLYQIEDLYFRFWYFFVPRTYSSIISGRIRDYYSKAIEPLIPDYMGKIFEKICAE